MIRRLWAAVAEPSMMRRSMLAQMAVLSFLWLLLVVFLAYDASKDVTTLRQNALYEAIFSVAENLEGQPDKMHATMAAMERAVRAATGTDADPALGPSMVVERGGQVLYRSQAAPAGVGAESLERIETRNADGRRWRTRALESPRSGLRVTMIVPADGMNIFLTLGSRGTLLLPLLVSLPFLILPAWAAARVGLGPWRRAMMELGTRGPNNLKPLVLQDRQRELTSMLKTINALLLRVGESAERERAFIADAAHELRTPLAAMRVNVEALQKQSADARQQQLLDGIVSSATRATRLVSQLLRLMRSDATAGELEVELPFDGLVQERMAALSGIADARGVELELSGDSGLTVAGHKESLVSLIDNLLDNAIKYSPDHGAVHVDLRREGASAVLRIADQGPGIAPELRERVFDRFFRDPRQAQGGSGLGLAIARAAAVQHGGEIVLDAVDGGAGLLVAVRLPLAPGAPGGA
jgi:two-component system sensor histidine kinase QseC